MKKRLLATMLCLSMAVAMTACGKSSSTDSAETNTSGDAGTSSEEEFPNFSVGLTEEGFIDAVTATDYVNLVDYKGIEIKKSDIEITDEDFDDYMKEEILNSYTETVEITDRTVQDDDLVNIDYVGKIDGEKFDGGSYEGYTVQIGVTSFIDDFIEQLIGHKIGETFDIEVTFPDEYKNNPDLAGKDATFTITINSISEYVYPEVNDEFVAKNFADYENAEEFLEAMREAFEFNQQLNYVWGYVVENSEVVSYPETYIKQYIDLQVSYYKYMAYANSTTFESLLSTYGMTESEFMTYLEDYAKLDVKSLLCVQAVCEKEGITATEEDIQSYMGISDASYLEYFYNIYGKGYLNQSILLQKAAAYATENAVVVE